MNNLDTVNLYFTFQDGFVPVKILAGNHIFERLAPQRTSIIFGVTELPWAVAAYRIDELIVQLEPNLDEVDAIAIENSGKARLVRDNAVYLRVRLYHSPRTLPDCTPISSTVAPNAMNISTNVHTSESVNEMNVKHFPHRLLSRKLQSVLSVMARFSTSHKG